MFGPSPPNVCLATRSASAVQLLVLFPSATANATGNGCTFNCDGGTCRVRGGDALPVELMDFSVEGAADGATPEDAESEPSDEEAEDGDDT